MIQEGPGASPAEPAGGIDAVPAAHPAARRPHRWLPLIRQLSWVATSGLLRLPVTPNQVTVASVALGVAAAACFARGAWLPGALLFLGCNVLDNSDGEIARLKQLQSRFGARLDEFGDWVVFVAIFVGMGLGAAQERGPAWLWLGVAAAAGTTVSYLFDLWDDHRERDADYRDDAYNPLDAPDTPLREKALFVFRVLLDADFAFILLAFACAGGVPWLMPFLAVGVQVHWMTAFAENARRWRA